MTGPSACPVVSPWGERCFVRSGHDGWHYSYARDIFWDEAGTYYIDEPNEPPEVIR